MTTFIIGFTGTRTGMNDDQKRIVRTIVEAYVAKFGGRDAEVVAALHGNCIGADEQFDDICSDAGIRRMLRPCTWTGTQAGCEHRGAYAIADPVRPLQRNRDIVADASIMIAAPPNLEELKQGSGTWATVRYTRRASKPLFLVYIDGNLFRERMTIAESIPLL